MIAKSPLGLWGPSSVAGLTTVAVAVPWLLSWLAARPCPPCSLTATDQAGCRHCWLWGLGPQGWDPSRRQQYKPRPAEEAWVRNAEGQDPGHQDVGKVVSGSDQWGYGPLPPEKLHATL